MLLPLLVVVVVVTDGDGISGGGRRLVPAPRAPTSPLPRTHSRSVKNGSRYAVLPALGEVLARCRSPRRRRSSRSTTIHSSLLARSLRSPLGCHARISIALIPILSIDSPATSRPRAFTVPFNGFSFFLFFFLSFSPASLLLDVVSTSTNECARADPVRDRRSRISLRHAKINKMAASAAERLRSLPKCSNRIRTDVCCDTHGILTVCNLRGKLDSHRWST